MSDTKGNFKLFAPTYNSLLIYNVHGGAERYKKRPEMTKGKQGKAFKMK
jgi:hypothetical protein